MKESIIILIVSAFIILSYLCLKNLFNKACRNYSDTIYVVVLRYFLLIVRSWTRLAYLTMPIIILIMLTHKNETIVFFFLGILILIVAYGVSHIIYTHYGVVKKVLQITSITSDYILYLRPFKHDNSYFEQKTKHITDELSKYTGYKVVSIGNPKLIEQTIDKNSAIYIINNQWKSKITKLKQQAKLIIIQLGDSEGIKWELKNTLDNVDKTLYIIQNKEQLDIFKEHLCNDSDFSPNSYPLIAYYHDISYYIYEISSHEQLTILLIDILKYTIHILTS